MKEAGEEMPERGMGFSTGLTVRGMKEIGKIIKQMVKASLLISMEMFMMGIGLMTRLQGLEHIIITMVLNTKVTGLTINNMGMELRFGSMEADIKEIMIWVKKVEKENTYGKMEVIMMEIGLIIE